MYRRISKTSERYAAPKRSKFTHRKKRPHVGDRTAPGVKNTTRASQIRTSIGRIGDIARVSSDSAGDPVNSVKGQQSQQSRGTSGRGVEDTLRIEISKDSQVAGRAKVPRRTGTFASPPVVLNART